eukprot:m.1424051 g.1424051  ORF g.1424051 m.1424051 type:complete len:57 (+) comp25059_c0_seq1:5537-5707(+)
MTTSSPTNSTTLLCQNQILQARHILTTIRYHQRRARGVSLNRNELHVTLPPDASTG